MISTTGKQYLCFLLLFGTFCLLFMSADKVVKISSMPPEKLLEKGDYFLNNNISDSAIIYYSLIYNSFSNTNDIISKQIVCKALNRASTVWFYHCDYKSSLELLLQALALCEEINYKEYIGGVYNNIGNVYYQFKDYQTARKYYTLAYKYGNDKYILGTVLNNLGMIAERENKTDSALLLYKKSLNLKSNIKSTRHNVSFSNIGVVHQSLGNYDSAFLYYRISLNDARQFTDKKAEAGILSNIGKLYFETDKYDSAFIYLESSNAIANNMKLFNILSDNYMLLYKIEYNRHNKSKALEYYKEYSIIKDSIFDASKYSTVSNMQFMYDMSKIDKQITKLNAEQEIKEKTIIIQRRFQIVAVSIIIVIIIFLILLYTKNKNLHKAYNTLVSKNIEIVNSDKIIEELRYDYEDKLKEKDIVINKLLNQNTPSTNEDSDSMKYKNSSLSNDYKNELIESILRIMENKEFFCDVDCSIDKLSKMIDSNPNYVSQIINDMFKKNFRTFINDYRIKEARRILSDSQCNKYTIDSIGAMVGFKSRRTFDRVFKESTGISPAFYFKSRNDNHSDDNI